MKNNREINREINREKNREINRAINGFVQEIPWSLSGSAGAEPSAPVDRGRGTSLLWPSGRWSGSHLARPPSGLGDGRYSYLES